MPTPTQNEILKQRESLLDAITEYRLTTSRALSKKEAHNNNAIFRIKHDLHKLADVTINECLDAGMTHERILGTNFRAFHVCENLYITDQRPGITSLIGENERGRSPVGYATYGSFVRNDARQGHHLIRTGALVRALTDLRLIALERRSGHAA